MSARLRLLAALAPALAALPVAPADAAVHGKAALGYASVPTATGAVVAYECQGAGIGFTRVFCSVTRETVVTRLDNGAVVSVSGTSYEVALRLVVYEFGLTRAYSCSRTLALATDTPQAGVLECTA